ncbi:Uncharacterised protein [Chlamydia trachomatis]|nr:Uncharacterised protein [Chlamydia trachomatis]
MFSFLYVVIPFKNPIHQMNNVFLALYLYKTLKK